VLYCSIVVALLTLLNQGNLIYVTICIDKCRYEIQEEKDVPVWYAGIYLPISSNVFKRKILKTLFTIQQNMVQLGGTRAQI
jgi:hypothetical protein